MPADEYAFRPTPQVRTFGQLIGYLAEENFFFSSQAADKKYPVTTDYENMPWTWSRVTAALILAGAFVFSLTSHHRVGDVLTMLGCLPIICDSRRPESPGWVNKPFEHDAFRLFHTPSGDDPFERGTMTHPFD